MRTCALFESLKWFLGAFSLFLVAGCSTARKGSFTEGPQLSKSDHQLAKALAHYGQGLLHSGENGIRSPAALEHFAKAAELDPREHRLSSKAALASLLQQHPEEAIEILKRSCRENPRSVKARMDLGAAYQLAGETGKAADSYRKGIRLAPEEGFSYVILARLLFGEDKDAEALRVLEKGIRRAREQNPLLDLGIKQGGHFLKTGNMKRAIPCYEFVTAYVSPPLRGKMLHSLGTFYLGVDDKKTAISKFSMAVKEDPPVPDAFVKLALLCRETDVQKAARILLDADRRLPDDLSILSTLGYVYDTDGQFDKAIEVFERIKEIAAESKDKKLPASFYLLYGSACERIGRFETAEEIFEKCIALYPDTHQVLNYLAYMWAEKGMKLDKALKYVTRALELDKDNGAYVDTLGWIYYQQRKYKEALAQIMKASKLITDDPTVIDHLGDVLNALGDKEQAMAHWKKSFLTDSKNDAVATKLREHGVDIKRLRKEARKTKKSSPGEAPDK